MLNVDRQGTVSVFRPSGALKGELLTELSDAIAEVTTKGRPSIVLDFAEIMLMDSAALEWLLEVDNQCSRRGGVFSVAGGGELVQDILRLTGVGDRLLRFNEPNEALRSYAQ